MKKTFLCIVLLVTLLLSFNLNASAAVEYQSNEPYDSYIYNSSDEPVAVPSPFSVDRVVHGQDITDTAFNSLTDVFYNGDGKVVLCDSGNNRIIIADTEFKKHTVLSSFVCDGKTESFNSPQGAWADKDSLYIADTGNHRIVQFEINGWTVNFSRVFSAPKILALGEDYDYSPVGLAVDSTDKIYVIASGVNQGLICLDENGEFQSFLGAPRVEPDILEALWRKIATKEQLSKMDSYVPTEYDAVTIDSNGFLYVCSKTSNEVPAAKLNSDGDDVLTNPKSGYFGDIQYLKQRDSAYAPYFTDIALNDSGKIGGSIYYVLDSKAGKIYAYNEDGYLLYIFGANGTQQGTFYTASAIEFVPASDNERAKLIVTDSFKATVTVFTENDFSAKVRNALDLYSNGFYDEAQTAWTELTEIASGYTLANIGLARIDIRKGNYRSAMEKAMQIKEHDLYSDAFGSWRDDFLRDNFGTIILVLLSAAVAAVVLLKLAKKAELKKRLNNNKVYKGYSYGTYVMFHPFDGFWDIKHEKRGNLKSAAVIAVLFFVFYALRLQFGGYVVTGVASDDVNVLYNLLFMFLPLLFFVIANWCFTTLMDGKGNMRDIITATCYSLKPYVVFALPMLILSNVLTASEVAFYRFFDIIILIWVLFLLFASLVSTHDYSFGKAVLTVVLILVGICLIIFIILLVISILQNIYQFSYNIYQELSFSSY